MPGDYEIPLCSNCEHRPIDPDTQRPVEGGLRVGLRALDVGNAVVIYSTVDPRVNSQFRIDPEADTSTLVREATGCTPTVQGLSAGMGSVEKRIHYEKRRERKARVCPLVRYLSYDRSLPKDLLYQTG